MPGPVQVEWWSEFVGLPFVDGGRDRAGLDCWGLVREVYRDRLGVTLPSYGEISARQLVRVAREMRRGQDDGWVSVQDPSELDVVLMRPNNGGDITTHVGVFVGKKSVLHTEPETGSVVVPISHRYISGRIRGYRRLVACEL